jgi:hypothetical protein
MTISDKDVLAKMPITDKDILAATSTYGVFKKIFGEAWEPYSTPAFENENLEIIYLWGKDNLPRGLADFQAFGSYELAFRACLTTLKRDPSWKTSDERAAEFAEEFSLLSADETRKRYDSDPVFKRNVDSMKKGVRQC